MKICIVTVYNSLNYGAFLQAYALNKVLNEFNGEVTFLETKARKPIKTTLKVIIKKLLKFKFKEVSFELVKLKSFLSSIRNFNILKNNDELLREQNIIVFGSDEIWNISRKGVRDYPILFGVGIPDNYFVSYAPSINTTTFDQIKKNVVFQNAILRFSKLSVRDYHSFNTLNEVTSKEIKIVLDPTLLLGNNFYSEIEEECNERDFILVYAYRHDLSDEEIKRIKEFSKSTNLKLISVGFYNDWCDKSVPASPFLFLSYMKNSKYVITNTFHGTIFSIIYQKQFLTYAGKKIKITDLLNKLNLENRIINNQSDLINLIKNEVNYEDVNNRLNEYRGNSYKYIEDFIRDV